jgi:hypothetical protein
MPTDYSWLEWEFKLVINGWKKNLKHCQISESEYQKIWTYSYAKGFNFDTIIDVTNIVEEYQNSKVNSDTVAFGNVYLVFKQPKVVANEAVECKHIYEHLDINWETGTVICNNCHITVDSQ